MKRINIDIGDYKSPMEDKNIKKQRLRRIIIRTLIVTLLIIMAVLVCTLYKEGKLKIKSADERKIDEYTKELKEEGYEENKAKVLAKERLEKEKEIEKRLKEGEKIDGYNGYFECRIKDKGLDSGYIQIGDMVFYQNYKMDVEDVRKVVEESSFELKCDEVFVASYKAIKVYDKKKKEVLTFQWEVTKKEDYPWLNDGNYLKKVTVPINTETPWDKESVYYPEGYLYFYEDYIDKEEIKTITIDELDRYIEDHDFNESTAMCNYGQDGFYYHFGREKTIIGFADYSRKDTITDEYGRENNYLVTRTYEFSWDTEGKLVSIKQIDTNRCFKLNI